MFNKGCSIWCLLIKEILAPDSYEIDSTPQRVEVKEEGKTYEVGNYSGKIFFNKL